MRCGFCEKAFRNEPAFMVHLCVGKQRDQERDEKHVRLGLQVFRKFFDYHYRKSDKTWTDFIKSRYYNDFIKVGRFISTMNVVNAPQFVDFLVKSNLPINKWTSPTVYETYLVQLASRESPDAAVSRNVSLMQLWAVQTGNDWTEFFYKVSPAQATLWVTTGRISPWMVYICNTAKHLLSRLSPEQTTIVGKYLDPKVWGPRLERDKTEVERLRALFDEVGV